MQPGDYVVDATCGNGRDSLVLAHLALTSTEGLLFGLDIQESAIAATQARLHTALDAKTFARVHLYQQSHSHFPEIIAPETVQLIVYNLGYLPGGDKTRTTRVDTTLASLKSAMGLLQHGGCISLTAYPGHTEGAKEREVLLDFLSTLDPTLWSCCDHRWVNRKSSPTLFLIQRTQPTTRL